MTFFFFACHPLQPSSVYWSSTRTAALLQFNSFNTLEEVKLSGISVEKVQVRVNKTYFCVVSVIASGARLRGAV